MEEQVSNLCPVQNQDVCGHKVVKEFLCFFLQLHKSGSLRGAKAVPVCCALIVSKVASVGSVNEQNPWEDHEEGSSALATTLC